MRAFFLLCCGKDVVRDAREQAIGFSTPLLDETYCLASFPSDAAATPSAWYIAAGMEEGCILVSQLGRTCVYSFWLSRGVGEISERLSEIAASCLRIAEA